MTNSPRQRNENKITGSTVVNSPVIAGTGATVTFEAEAGELDQRLVLALTDLRNRLREVDAKLGGNAPRQRGGFDSGALAGPLAVTGRYSG